MSGISLPTAALAGTSVGVGVSVDECAGAGAGAGVWASRHSNDFARTAGIRGFRATTVAAADGEPPSRAAEESCGMS